MDYTKLRSLALEYKDLCTRFVFTEKAYLNAQSELNHMRDLVGEKSSELREEMRSLDLAWPSLLEIDGVLHLVSPQKVEPATILK